jgi:hypothetical protein
LAALILLGRWFTGQAYRAKAKLAEQGEEV